MCGICCLSSKKCGMPDPTYTFDAQMLFAANMRRIRLSKTMTQEMVAEYAELHPNYISSVERGERNISIRNIAKIARALSVTMPELLTEPPPGLPAMGALPGRNRK